MDWTRTTILYTTLNSTIQVAAARPVLPRPPAPNRPSGARSPDPQGALRRYICLCIPARSAPRPGEGASPDSRCAAGRARDAARAPASTRRDEQVGVGEPARLPQLREHADRGEAGDRVDLVHEQLARRPLQEEVDARVAGRVHRSEGARPPGAATSRDRVRRRGARESASSVRLSGRVLRVVVVELAVGDDLAGHRGLGVVVAEHRRPRSRARRAAASTTTLRS